jgi:Acetyltransferase (GNAT) domain
VTVPSAFVGSAGTATPGAATTGVVVGFEHLRPHGRELDALVGRCGAPATAGTAWVFAALAHDPVAEPWGVLVRDDAGLLTAAAVLVDVPDDPAERSHPGLHRREVSEDEGTGEVRLAGAGSGHRTALLADGADAAARLGRDLAELFSARAGSWRVDLGPLEPGSPVVAELTDSLPGLAVDLVEAVPVVVRTGSAVAEDYLPTGVRRTLRKASNRLDRDGRELTVRFSRDRNRVVRMLPTLEECHRDRDHARGRVSDLDDAEGRLLWHARMRGLAEVGVLELATARIDGQLAAYVLGVVDGTSYRVLEGHLVTEWARYAPGRLLETAVLQRMLDDESLQCLDWMTAVAPDSLLATNATDPMVALRMG